VPQVYGYSRMAWRADDLSVERGYSQPRWQPGMCPLSAGERLTGNRHALVYGSMWLILIFSAGGKAQSLNGGCFRRHVVTEELNYESY